MKPSKTTDSFDSVAQVQLDVLMREYESLRQESTHCDSTQMSLATTVFGFLAAVFALTQLFEKKQSTADFLFYAVLPCFAMFFGLLWVDQLYRRVRFGTYLRRTENKIRMLLPDLCSNSVSVPVCEFEHWISALDDHKPFLKRPRFAYGCVLAGTWFLTPILIPASRLLLFSNATFPFSYYWSHKIVMILVFAVFLVYYYYLILLIRRINTFSQEAALTNPQPTMDY